MEEPNPTPVAESPQASTTPAQAVQADPVMARGSAHILDVPREPSEHRERTDHSVMEGLPPAKAERIASMRRELADLQRQLIEAQQRIATELQGRAEDAERFEALEARLQAQELKAEQEATRAAGIETEIAGLRAQLATATAAAEELQRAVATRDVQLEEVRQQHRDAKNLVETRDAELTSRTAERDTEQATRSRLERELAATTSDRDALKGELEQARRERDAVHARAREVANQIVRFGQDLIEVAGDAGGGAGGVETASTAEPKPAVAVPLATRPQPPPVPSAPARAEPRNVEMILEVTEEPKPATSRIRSGLVMVGVGLLGCAATIAIMKSSSSTAAGYTQDLGAPPPSARALPLTPATASPAEPSPMMRTEPIGVQSAFSPQPSPGTDPSVAPGTDEETAPPPTEIATEGTILLPPAAERHRVFVDDKVVQVESSRAVVPCGTHEIRIGSRGTARNFDVACGGETEIPEPPRNR